MMWSVPLLFRNFCFTASEKILFETDPNRLKELRYALTDAFKRAEADRATRVVLLRGAGGARANPTISCRVQKRRHIE